jgi:hypothetical protein
MVSDWTLTGVLTLQSGIPIPVTQTTNNNAFAGFGTQRPNRIDDPALSAGERSVSRWFNTARVCHRAPIRDRHELAQSGARSRLSQCRHRCVASHTAAGEQRVLEMRAEVFNVTNTPALGAPNTTLGSAAFGTITSAGDPRVFQLALKVMF